MGSYVNAHALQPAALTIQAITGEQFNIAWKRPAVSGRPISLDVELPSKCQPFTEPSTKWNGNAFTSHWRVACEDGLKASRIGISGLEKTLTDVLVTVIDVAGNEQTSHLTATKTSLVVTVNPSFLESAITYSNLGFRHILLGIDHLLFVLVLLLLVQSLGSLIAAITGFTIAHSIALALSVLDVIRVPQMPVEAIIALSISYVAVEVIRAYKHSVLTTTSRPWFVAFFFGLLHGLGFASALNEIGFAQHNIPVALLFFNLGVEVGQLLFIAVAGFLIWIGRRFVDTRFHVQVCHVTAYIIGVIAMYWFFERSFLIISPLIVS